MSTPATAARFSVVVPAHNEAAVIDRCLDAFLVDLAPGEAEVVVAANGCTDDTAERARRHGVTVVELAAASKTAALNAGDRTVSAFPRVYLDADIVVTARALRDLTDALRIPQPAVGAPLARYRTDGRPAVVKAFYRAYEQTPYLRHGHVGGGVYAVNEAGRRRFGDFPDVTADDLFVQRLFPPERRMHTPGAFDVEVPRDLRSLVRIRRRTAAGNRQLASLPTAALPRGLDQGATTWSTWRTLLRVAVGGPRQAAEVTVYAAVVLAGRLGSRNARAWERDDSTRRASGAARAGEQPSVAYLVSRYPAVSHAFIEREIRALRSRGWHVDAYSVRPCPADELLSDGMRAEAADVTVILRGSWAGRVLRAARTAASHPFATAVAARQAMASGPPTATGRLWQAFYLVEALLLHREMAGRRPRHLHVHFANNGADVARLVTAFGNAARRGADRAWTWSIAMHGPTEFEAPVEFDLAAKLDAADAVAAISGYCAGRVRELLPAGSSTPVRIVPMSVDVDRYRPRRTSGTGNGAAPLRVLFVGRLVPEKRPGDLLAAVARARRDGLRCDVVIVGAGPLRAELERSVTGLRLVGVRFLGAVGQDELPAWYGWTDVVCLPSESEGLPVVLMEAMASGRPVITTDVAAIPELVSDGRHGRVVSPGDVDGLAEALVRLGADAQARAEMGRLARRTVTERHASSTAVDALIGLLDEVASA